MHTKLTCITLFFITCNGIPKDKVRKENGKSGSIIGHVSELERLEHHYGKLGVLKYHKRVKKYAGISDIIAGADENDEYYEKGGTGNSDNSNDDNYENKDWSDIFREDPVTVNYDKKAMMKHAILTDIEGINVMKDIKIHDPKRVKKRQVDADSETDLNDNYYDKGGTGENDNSNDDNYENQDWSDLYRDSEPGINAKNLFANFNESYIEGIPATPNKTARTSKPIVTVSRKINKIRNH